MPVAPAQAKEIAGGLPTNLTYTHTIRSGSIPEEILVVSATSFRQRLDQELVDPKLASSRSQAQWLIRAGRVALDGQMETRPGRRVAPTGSIELLEPLRYVSRGVLTLEHALDTSGARSLWARRRRRRRFHRRVHRLPPAVGCSPRVCH